MGQTQWLNQKERISSITLANTILDKVSCSVVQSLLGATKALSWEKGTRVKKSLRAFVFLFAIIMLASPTYSAVWDGGGADNLASTSANWAGNTLPPTGDGVLFDGTSSKECTWDIDAPCPVFVIDGGYAGAVTVGSTLTVCGDYVPAPPAAPSGLSADAVSASRIDLSWTDNSGNETGFKIEKKTGVGGAYSQIGTAAANATAYSDTSLLPGTTYYYQVRAYDVFSDSAYSDPANATTPAVAPSVVTEAVSNNGGTTATLNGTVNPNGAQTTVSFEWGMTSSYGSVTLDQLIPAGTAEVSVSASLTGLAPSALYYYRVKAVNSMGTAYGSEASFATPITAPAATTNPETNNTGNSATLNGTINPNGGDTSVHFEWGVDLTYGHSTQTQTIPAGTGAVSVAAGITGLSANTGYHYRVVATNASGTTNGSDSPFTTPVIAPSAATNPASNNSGNAATLNGTVNPNGAETSAHFEWGATAAYGNTTPTQTIPSGTSVVAVSADITGLTPNNPCHFRMVATNSVGTTNGTDASFTTPVIAPSAITNPVSGNTGNAATLNASVNPNGAQTFVHFEWGTDASYGNSTSVQTIPPGTSSVDVTANVSGLSVNGSYRFRVIATNSAGTTNGNDVAFATPSNAPPLATTAAVGNKNGNSATLNGSVNPNGLQVSAYFEWGTDASYGNTTAVQLLPAGAGNVSMSSTITGLTANTTYHYRIVAINSDGTTNGSDATFTTSKITITITYPPDGSTIYRPDIMAAGTLVTAGSETGVTVNGTAGMVIGTQFVANHLPLSNGANAITVTATDTEGNTATTAILVTAVTDSPYVRLTASPESGIAPLTVNFAVSTAMPSPVTTYKMDFDGDAVIDYTGSSFSSVSHAYESPAIYFATLTVVGSTESSYTDTVAIIVTDQNNMDGMFKNKWNTFKAKLAAKDVAGGLNLMKETSRSTYQQALGIMIDDLPQLISDMQTIELIYVTEDTAKYRINRLQNIDGSLVTITYYIYFSKDSDGLWKIREF